MSKIKILDESLINKIAAGEVIERPASVVKELVENSIDAESTKIFVDIEDGGKNLIKVSDNGTGMSKEDAAIAFERHSTSKIKDINDLFSIKSLGFRGEALASIASVSELEVKTKSKDSMEGTKIIIEGGNVKKSETIGFPQGTSITIRNIFFNTPARKKYLKPNETENRHIIDVITKYSLSHPYIHFRLKNNGKEIINSPQTDSQLTNISFLYGSNTAKQLIEVNYVEPNIVIKGYISKPKLNRASKGEQSFFVNQRYVKKATILSNALNDAYHTFMMVGRYPVSILSVQIAPEKIDVNVHPTKAEIKFEDEKSIYNAMFNAITKTLEKSDLIPEELEDVVDKKIEDFGKVNYTKKEYQPKYLFENSEQKTLETKTPEIKTKKLPEIRSLGIINKTYIVAEMRGNLTIIDQHAAAERILYEKFLEETEKEEVKKQKLLDPQIIVVPPSLVDFLESNLEFFDSCGYEIEKFGKIEFLIRTYPVLFGSVFNKELFFELLDDLHKDKKINSAKIIKHEKIASKACRAAIKAGDEISVYQVAELLNELDKKNVPYNCPHGRPIIIKFSYYELEKMFKRIV
ncbi:DNA mismatch repair endonuclease MutL [archaeon]|nr:DNA mismatch repair endonuclease MutL [archaeon]MBT4647700.1 DNA mismatch repair endonuclease MutL [archaeon]MBT6822372.1 DNA mismatch repair endonuclease MutL [archaeon]